MFFIEAVLVTPNRFRPENKMGGWLINDFWINID